MAVADDVLDRHMAAFGKQDMEGVIADYAENAVMFTAGGAIRGHDALRQAFAGMFAEWGKPGTTFSLQQRIVDEDHAFIAWEAETADNRYEGALDAFTLEHGRIVAHFFGGKITPKTV